ncbi:MAG TPA: TlpA disulfide reductase family protein [Vicinamibacteria bacterium]
MRKFLLLVGLATCAPAPPTDVETSVHEVVREAMAKDDGRVDFSDLHNNHELTADELAYLDRLYEVFFALPAYLQSEFRATGKIPAIEDIAHDYRIHSDGVRLLLTVMTSEPRMPNLILLDETSGEIASIDEEEIDEFVEKSGSQVRLVGWVGKPVPAFEVSTLNGEKITNRDLVGKRTLIFFWLTRCPICRRIAPTMVELYKKHGGAELEILGLNVDEALGLDVSDQERREFISQQGIEYPVAMLDSETRSAFGNINVFPAMFWVKSDGTIGELLLNYQDLETLESLVQSRGD